MTQPLRILAFDLDDTLHDPGSALYDELHRSFLSGFATHPPIDEVLAEFERLRQRGDALERLGLANPIHHRGHPQSLAAFAATVPWEVLPTASPRTDAEERSGHRRALDRLQTLVEATRCGTPAARLETEIELRRMLSTCDELRSLRRRVVELAESPAWLVESRRYAAMEAAQRHVDVQPLLSALSDRGAIVVFCSQGRIDVQSAKLRRLGLGGPVLDRLLVTENAERIPGRCELDRRLDDGLERCARGAVPDDELRSHWRIRCALDRWARKSAEFYARCLHAIVVDPNDCRRALTALEVAPGATWQRREIRFVMVGDRLDTDVEPVVDCLGRERCETIHFRAGKYASRRSVREEPGRVPHRTFTCWAELQTHLRDCLDWRTLPTLRTAPAILNRADWDPELVRSGLRSPLAAVRAVSELAAEFIERSDPRNV